MTIIRTRMTMKLTTVRRRTDTTPTHMDSSKPAPDIRETGFHGNRPTSYGDTESQNDR